MRESWKRRVALVLTAILLLSAGPLNLLREGILVTALGADEIYPGEQTTLRFGMTWLYNNGNCRETTGSGYLRNKARKEYLTGDTGDSDGANLQTPMCSVWQTMNCGPLPVLLPMWRKSVRTTSCPTM